METNWISIKEMLPEDPGYYLVTYFNLHTGGYETSVLLWYNCSRNPHLKKMRWSSRGIACTSTVSNWAEMPEPATNYI